jgi:tetratricopeptide (TPR) repeat protein
MIGLEHPLRLAWLVPWLVLVLVLLRLQLRALAWLRSNVAERFLGQLTRSRPSTMKLHLLFLLVAGSLLIVAAAGPYRIGPGERVVETQTIVLVLDASLSMGAGDASAHPVTGEEVESRFDQARQLCQELVAAMPEASFALITFSGDAVIHSPPTRDHHALQTLLGALRYHIYSQSMGSRFSSAFDAVIHMMSGHSGRYQVVLLSDGEISVPDSYDDGLRIFADRGVPVHTVGVGSRTWQKMTVNNLDDVMAGADEPRTAAEYRTRRESKELKRMSSATGGEALIVDYLDWVEELQEALADASPEAVVIGGRTRIDLSRYPLLAFLLCFLVETIGLDRRPCQRRSSTLVVLACVITGSVITSGCGSPLIRSHLLNEQGIDHYWAEEHEQAAPLFERSAAYGVREHVPIYNLANTYLARGDLSAAHERYEQAIKLEPKLAEAYYNDGHALYQWGEKEIDPTGCQLDRTRALWQQAGKRFTRTIELAGATSTLGRAAEANCAHIEQALQELEKLAENCPQDESPSGGGGGGGSGGEGKQGGGGGEGDEGKQGGGGGGSGGAPPPLSQDEQDQIAAALERIRSEASEALGYRQNRRNHLTSQSAEGAAGKKIWW